MRIIATLALLLFTTAAFVTPSAGQVGIDPFFEKMQRDSEMDRLRWKQQRMREDIDRQRIEQQNEADRLRVEQNRMRDQLRNDLGWYR